MNASQIESKFAQMGARVKLREVPDQFNGTTRDYAVDIQRDRDGQFFEVRIPTHLRGGVDVSVMQSEPKQRHLLLMVRKAGDKPQLENRGSDAEPSYHVVGVLTTRGELLLPGGTFQASDGRQLRDYFERLAADGVEFTAPRGRFGLTEGQFAAVHADLAQSIGFATKGQPLRTVLDRLQAKFAHRYSPDAAAAAILRDAAAVEDEVGNLTAGTGLAILLRRYGLALRPEKSMGQPVVHRIVPLDAATDDAVR